jgi:hypothetical protein
MFLLEKEKEIVDAYKNILSRLKELSFTLEKTNNYFFWLDPRSEKRVLRNNPLEKLLYIMNLMTLHPNQQSKTVILCPGFIAASDRVYEQVLQLNGAKQHFQELMVAIRKHILHIQESTLDNQFGNPSHERPKAIQNFLQKIQLEHLHFKHVYRCFPVLERTPVQLSWTWAHTQSIKRISHEQAISLLERRNKNDRYDEQIQMIQELNKNKVLTLRQKLKPHLRVNVTYKEKDRGMLKGTMPIVFPIGNTLPKIKPATPVEEQKERARRRDKRTSEEAFIPAIRLFINE